MKVLILNGTGIRNEWHAIELMACHSLMTISSNNTLI